MAEEWRRFHELRRQIDRLATAATDEDWDHRWPKPPACIEPAVGPARVVVYLTKRSILNMLASMTPDLPWPPPELAGVTWFCRYGLVTRGVAQHVAEVSDGGRVPIVFLGDLDPFDLTTYLSLRARLARIGIEPRFGGVDGTYSDACRSRWAQPDSWCIGLSPFERATWSLIRREPALSHEVIGASAAALLDRGLKLELEATAWVWPRQRDLFAEMISAA